MPSSKRWLNRYEWISYSSCGDDPRFTNDFNTPEELAAAQQICTDCPVRVECIQHCLETKSNSVMVAGTWLPDPMFKNELAELHEMLRVSLPAEIEARGEGI